jgi:hypothetical protein
MGEIPEFLAALEQHQGRRKFDPESERVGLGLPPIPPSVPPLGLADDSPEHTGVEGPPPEPSQRPREALRRFDEHEDMTVVDAVPAPERPSEPPPAS